MGFGYGFVLGLLIGGGLGFLFAIWPSPGVPVGKEVR